MDHVVYCNTKVIMDSIQLVHNNHPQISRTNTNNNNYHKIYDNLLYLNMTSPKWICKINLFSLVI